MNVKKHIIIAPHADDEIIGCFTFLQGGAVRTVAFPANNMNAIEEAYHIQGVWNVNTESFFTQDYLMLIKYHKFVEEREGYLLFPDPLYEYHPEHKLLGGMGMHLVRRGFKNILFYSTNMNAPYIREVEDPINKRDALNRCYPDKESLWQYDHKYFLFEGYVNYNPV